MQKQITTYNQLADDIVADFMSNPDSVEEGMDQKNIRRRVYDALNVLVAMNIIAKDKKEYKWIGLVRPTACDCLANAPPRAALSDSSDSLPRALTASRQCKG
jgi:hypothetical protein